MVIEFQSPYGDCEHLRPTIGTEETSNVIKASYDIARGFGYTGQCYLEIFRNASSKPGGLQQLTTSFFINDFLIFFNYIDHNVVWAVIALAVLWTLARYILVALVFKPAARWSGVREQNIEKLSESAWKGLAYLIMWTCAVKVVFFHGYNIFSEPTKQFSDWSMAPPPTDLAIVYALEFSFYLHCVYGTLYMDAWRKDSIVMLTHHFVTMTLIGFSYIIRCLKIGCLIFALNDISDVMLECGKVASYLRHRSSGFSRFFSAVSDITSVFFLLSWVVNRLIFHLTKVWRAGSFGIWVSHPLLPLPFHNFLNCFLGTLYLFYLYWFWFIVIFIVRMFRGNHGSAEDPREDDEEKGVKKSTGDNDHANPTKLD